MPPCVRAAPALARPGLLTRHSAAQALLQPCLRRRRAAAVASDFPYAAFAAQTRLCDALPHVHVHWISSCLALRLGLPERPVPRLALAALSRLAADRSPAATAAASGAAQPAHQGCCLFKHAKKTAIGGHNWLSVRNTCVKRGLSPAIRRKRVPCAMLAACMQIRWHAGQCTAL